MDNFKLNRFGWQGVSFLKPENWELAEVEGDVNKGYARLDDGLVSRIQLRWHKTANRADMEAMAKKQSRRIQKTGGGGAGKNEISDFKSRSFNGKKFEFESEGAESVYYMVQCRDCMQVVLLGIFGRPGESIQGVADKVIKSLRDHAAGGEILWGAFGFVFRAPVELHLKNHYLRSGDLAFEFGSSGDTSVYYHRVGIANILLKNSTINKWTVDFLAERHKKIRIEASYDAAGSKENAVRARGVETGRMGLVRKPAEAFFWNCEDTNHIYGIVVFGRNPVLDPGELARGIPCH